MKYMNTMKTIPPKMTGMRGMKENMRMTQMGLRGSMPRMEAIKRRMNKSSW